MIKEGFNPQKLFVIYNSLNYRKQLELRESLCKSSIFSDHFKNDSPVIIMIVRLNIRKKFDSLLYVLSALNKKQII